MGTTAKLRMREIRKGRWFGRCKICREEKALCDAHLYPDSLKKIAEDWSQPKAKVFAIDLIEMEQRSAKQTLPYDPKILCGDCDSRLGRLDERFKNALLTWANFPHKNIAPSGQKGLVFADAGIAESDLFLGGLASLLRFSFSDRSSEIYLGPKYETSIAEALMEAAVGNQPAEINCAEIRVLACTAWLTSTNIDLTKVMKSEPLHIRAEGAHIYVLDLFGIIIFFKIGRGAWPTALSRIPHLVDGLGQMSMMLVDPGFSISGMAMGRAVDGSRRL